MNFPPSGPNGKNATLAEACQLLYDDICEISSLGCKSCDITSDYATISRVYGDIVAGANDNYRDMRMMLDNLIITLEAHHTTYQLDYHEEGEYLTWTRLPLLSPAKAHAIERRH